MAKECPYYTFLCREAEKLGMTKPEFSRELGMSSDFIKSLGKGNVKGLRRKTRIKVAALIGHQVEEDLYSASFDLEVRTVCCLLSEHICKSYSCCYYCKDQKRCEYKCKNSPDKCGCTDKR